MTYFIVIDVVCVIASAAMIAWSYHIDKKEGRR